jgi:hypothetical protein
MSEARKMSVLTYCVWFVNMVLLRNGKTVVLVKHDGSNVYVIVAIRFVEGSG